MNIFDTTLKAAVRRPFIIILPLVLGFFCYLLNMYNPITPLVAGLAGITGGTAFEGLVSLIQMLIDPAFVPIILIAFAAIILFSSLFAGIALSGYLNVVSAAVEGKGKKRGEFAEGLKRYFSRLFLISLRTVPFILLLAVFMLISCLPAIIVTRATLTDKPELLFAAVFVDILTFVVLLFGFLFSSTYILFWYPSALKTGKRPFTHAKRLVDGHFWGIILRVLVFDIVFAIIHYALFAVNAYLLRHIIGWLFDTAFFTMLSVYAINTFRTLDISENEGE